MNLQPWPSAADTVVVVHGGAESAGQVYRPRMVTAKASAIACAVFLVMSLVGGSRNAIWLAAVPFMFFVQCFQHLEVTGNHVRRVGLRSVELHLGSASVAATGRSWWVELFFLGRCLELRDTDGHRLFLESWLWSKGTRQALVDSLTAANPNGVPAHS